jgi:hypothetical protein
MDEVQAQLKNEYLEDSIKKQKKTEQQVLINQYCQVTGTAKINSIRKELLQSIENAGIERFLAEALEDSGDEGSHEKKSASSRQTQSARKRLRKSNEVKISPVGSTKGRLAKGHADSNISDFFKDDDDCGGDNIIEAWDDGDHGRTAAVVGN